MKYRKKPLIVEAFQLDYKPGVCLIYTQGDKELPDWFNEAMMKSEREQGQIYRHANGLLVIYTLEGLMEIMPGDYVIRGIAGEIYPCKPEIFEASYEPA